MSKEGWISIFLGVLSTIASCIIIPLINRFISDMSVMGWVILSVGIVLLVVLSISLPLIIGKLKRRKQKMLENQSQLKEKYTSLFAEDNKLKTETITISKLSKNKIQGKVELVEHFLDGQTKSFSYNLTGRYSDKIITAEYLGGKSERGTINLKLIDLNVFSGFCSFSKMTSGDDEIRVSPYVWVEGDQNDLLNGTFDFCTNCHINNLSCCCSSNAVDMPLILNFELERIKHGLQINMRHENNYSEDIADSQLRQMKNRVSANGEGCIFFDDSTNQCKIYENRPLDCRLFPFDVRFSKDTKEFMIGYYSNICKNIPEKTTMIKKAHILRPYFFLLYPYLNIFTLESLCPKLSKIESGWVEIAKFKDFIF